jgi:hypothetical protein
MSTNIIAKLINHPRINTILHRQRRVYISNGVCIKPKTKACTITSPFIQTPYYTTQLIVLGLSYIKTLRRV